MLLHTLASQVPFSVRGTQWFASSVQDILVFVLLLGFAALVLLEVRRNRGSHRDTEVRKSYRTNLRTFLFNDMLMSLLSVSSLLALAESHNRWGLLSRVDSTTVKAVVSFVLLDMVLYFWHKAAHRFDWLWAFHKVHHSDRSMNVSTAFRLHFVEVLLTVAVKAVFVVVSGIDAAIVAVNEAIVTLFVMFHHANVTLQSEELLSRLLIVPGLHRLHHSTLRSEHDQNYGAVFSIWDRLFGTLDERQPAEIGLRQVPSQDFLELLKFGFVPNAPRSPSPETVAAMVAEAAYYRAERRGFVPGSEMQDWLEAEQEVFQTGRYF